MASDETYVVVGGGLAGARAIESLRDNGFDGSIMLITVEDELPYERPVLSKGYLLGTEERDSAYVHDRSWYDDHRVDVRLGQMVTGIDRSAREVMVDGGERIAYDTLLLATGSWPRRLDVPGADLDGVLYLRDLHEADAIKQAIEGGGPLVVVGAGWIGLEVAAAAREHDVAVTILETADLPLQRVLGDEVAQIFADLHRKHGVDLRFGTGIESIDGADGRVTGVTTSAGDRLPCTHVVVGIGVQPQVDWALDSGLEGGNGLDVDARLRTSDPSIFAAGDIAAIDHPSLGRRVRVEHWAMANDTGTYVGGAMLGHDETFQALPFFYTDQYDLGMEYIGYVEPGEADRVVISGDVDGLAFRAFWLSDRRVLAGMHVNMWDDGIDPIKDLVASRRQVDPDRLADDSIALSHV